MGQVKPSERARDRILDDDEIRHLHRVLDLAKPFDRFVWYLLHSALRRNEAGHAVWGEVKFVNEQSYRGYVLDIPGSRMKGKLPHVVPLVSLHLLGDAASAPHERKKEQRIFAGVNPFSRNKAELDKRLPPDMPRWTLHDCRRTARSLMARAGVPEEHAERCLAHVQGGVAGIYNRYEYLREKADALQKIETLIASIVSGKQEVDLLAAMAVEHIAQWAKQHGIDPSQIEITLKEGKAEDFS
jgi:integrase